MLSDVTVTISQSLVSDSVLDRVNGFKEIVRVLLQHTTEGWIYNNSLFKNNNYNHYEKQGKYMIKY